MHVAPLPLHAVAARDSREDRAPSLLRRYGEHFSGVRTVSSAAWEKRNCRDDEVRDIDRRVRRCGA